MSRWWVLYQTRMLIRAAPVEGAAFLNLIAYLVEGQSPARFVGIALIALGGWFATASIRGLARRFGRP